MSCIVCGNTPHNEPFRKDYIIVNDGTKHGSRSKELHDFCPDCHQKGDYSSLASAVIAEAIEDYCYPKFQNKGRRQEVVANQMSAKGFLFSDKLIIMFTKEDWGEFFLALAVLYLLYWRFGAWIPFEKLFNP